jgi:hypothetical protein
VLGTDIGCDRTSDRVGNRISFVPIIELLMHPDAHPVDFLATRRVLRKKLTTFEAQPKIFWNPLSQSPQHSVVCFCVVFSMKLDSFEIGRLYKPYS